MKPLQWNRDFGLFWAGTAMSVLANAVTYVALPFLVLESGYSSSDLAVTILMGTLPHFLAPWTGRMADRAPLKYPLILTQLVRVALPFSLGFFTITDGVNIDLVYLVTFVNNLLALFTVSAPSICLPSWVAAKDRQRANSLMAAAPMGSPLISMGLGGALIARIGPAEVLLILPVPLLLSTTFLLGPHFPIPSPAESSTNPLASSFVGLRLLVSQNHLRLLILMGILPNLELNFLNVRIPLDMSALGQGAAGYGLFESLLAGGALAGMSALYLAGPRLSLYSSLGLGNLLVALGCTSLLV